MRSDFSAGALCRRVSVRHPFLFSTVLMDGELCLNLVRRLHPGLELEGLRLIPPSEDPGDTSPVLGRVLAEGKCRNGRRALVQIRLDADRDEILGSVGLIQREMRALPTEDGRPFALGEDRVVLLHLCLDDPFGRQSRFYTFEMEADDEARAESLELLVFNASGILGMLPDGMTRLLDYFRDPEAFPVTSEDPLIARLDAAVRKTRSDPFWQAAFLSLFGGQDRSG